MTIDHFKEHNQVDGILATMSQHFPLEKWDEDTTPLRRSLFLDGSTFHPPLLFHLPAVTPDKLSSHYLVSPAGRFAYQNRTIPKGRPLGLLGVKNGWVVFNSDVVQPTLIDLTRDGRNGEFFPPGMSAEYRVMQGAIWMSSAPSEMLTQRPAVQKAEGKVLLGGLGLGWLLGKVSAKDTVEEVIVVEKSKELLQWYGNELCLKYPKVREVICDDVYNQLGRHGGKTIYLLDIWHLYSGAKEDKRLRHWKRKLKKRLWVWGRG